MDHQRCVTIGTAGHIDHGKTALVHALTGKNTDRLKEEQARGISIDIDFAPLYYPDGTLIGMVDVPGHERFVRNMVAGAAGIDGALLVIDLREGVKPQTLEHIAILELLGVRHGVIALTKADLVDSEWMDVARDIIAESLSETFLSNAPIVMTSTKTGQGIAALTSELHDLAVRLVGRDDKGAFRLPVDKVYSIPGFGTVVSGTVWRGQISVGDAVDLLPRRKQTRVRGIQIHGQPMTVASAGQRAAINLHGIDKAEVTRGMVVASQGTLQETKLMDIQLRVLPTYPRPLRHRDRVHVHIGTAETIGRILLLEDDELLPGQNGLAQVLLDKAVTCSPGDALIVRSYSPVTTLGGGIVIDSAPIHLHRRKRGHVIEALNARLAESPMQRLLSLSKQGMGLTAERVSKELGLTNAEAERALHLCVKDGVMSELPTAWYHQDAVNDGLRSIRSALEGLHSKRRFSMWVPRTLVTGAGPQWPARDLDWLLEQGAARGMWVLDGANIRAEGREVTLTAEEQDIFRAVMQALEMSGVSGVTGEQLAALVPHRDRVAKALMGYAQERGLAVQVEPEVWVSTEALSRAIGLIRSLFADTGPFTLAAVRDRLSSSRKTAVTLLEYLDKIGVTVRKNDVRYVAKEVDGWSNGHGE